MRAAFHALSFLIALTAVSARYGSDQCYIGGRQTRGMKKDAQNEFEEYPNRGPDYGQKLCYPQTCKLELSASGQHCLSVEFKPEVFGTSDEINHKLRAREGSDWAAIGCVYNHYMAELKENILNNFCRDQPRAAWCLANPNKPLDPALVTWSDSTSEFGSKCDGGFPYGKDPAGSNASRVGIWSVVLLAAASVAALTISATSF